VFIVSVMSKVTHMLQFLHQMFDLFALLRDDPLKPATPLTNGMIDEMLQQFAPMIACYSWLIVVNRRR